MSTLKDRLAEARTEAGLSQAQLAKAVGAGQSTIASIENGRNKGSSLFLDLARALNVNVEWLMDGAGPKRGDAGTAGDSKTPPPPPWPFPAISEADVRRLPPAQLGALQGALGLAIAQLNLGVDVAAQSKGERLEKAKAALLSVAAAANDARYVAIRKVAVKVRAGAPGFSADQTAEEFDGEISLPQKWLDERKLRADQLIATSVFGDSMEPRITKDDLLLVNTADTTRTAGKIFGVNHDGEFVVKRLERRDGYWHLTSDSPDQAKHPPVRCNDKTFIIGRIVLLQAERI